MNDYFKNLFCEFLDGKKDVSDIDLKQYPKKLYKYRACTKYSFDSLCNEYLWMDHPKNYDDPFDSLVSISIDDLRNSFEENMNRHLLELFYFSLPPQGMHKKKNGISLEIIKNSENIFVDSSGNYDRENGRERLFQLFKSFSYREKLIIMNALEGIAKSHITKEMEKSFEKFISTITNNIRNDYMTCCLSKRNNNRKMWEEYADKYKGFVIEYSMDKNIEYSGLWRYLFEIEYYEKIPDLDLRNLFEVFFQKNTYNKPFGRTSNLIYDMALRLLMKSSDYLKEEEWRFVAGDLEDQRVIFSFVSAVYAGYKISEENLLKLKAICNRKSIPIYMQEFDMVNGTVNFNLIN